MKCLVTGATGLLGNNLVRQLLDRGDQVRCFSRSASKSPSLNDLDVERLDGELGDEAAMDQAMHGIDHVFHCAASVRIGWTGKDEFHRVNVLGAEIVARAALERSARMIYVSSVNALGVGWRDRPADEVNSNPDITPCPYVTSKRAATEKMDELFQLENADIVLVLPGFMLGPWDWKPSSGQMLLDVAAGRSPVTPTGGMSLCDARDVAQGAILAAEKGQAGRKYILAGHNLTYRAAWTKFASLTGRRPPLIPLGPLARLIGGSGGDFVSWWRGRESLVNSASVRISSLPHFFSSQRAIDELGYSIRPVEATIEDSWEWFDSHGYTKT